MMQKISGLLLTAMVLSNSVFAATNYDDNAEVVVTGNCTSAGCHGGGFAPDLRESALTALSAAAFRETAVRIVARAVDGIRTNGSTGSFMPPGAAPTLSLQLRNILSNWRNNGYARSNRAPNGTISAPASNVTITQGQSFSFAATASDPLDTPPDTPFSYSWNFGAGSGVSNSTLQNPTRRFDLPGSFPVQLTLRDSEGLADPSPDSVTVTVQALQPGTLQFDSLSYSINESADNASITVTRVGGSDGTASVAYASTDNSATAGIDYTAISGTLSWVSGESTAKSFFVPIIDDNDVEGSETLTLSLSNADVAALGSPAVSQLTITDDDGATVNEILRDDFEQP